MWVGGGMNRMRIEIDWPIINETEVLYILCTACCSDFSSRA